MSFRALLWIAAPVTVVAAAASMPPVAGGAADDGWDVTIDGPSTFEVESRHLVVTGTAARHDGPDPVSVSVSVSVTVVPDPESLPPACGPELTGTGTVSGRQYTVEIDVRCNGPHQVQVVAHSDTGLTSGSPVVRDVGVAERPPTPATPPWPAEMLADGGMVVAWEPTTDPDTAGSILRVDYREVAFGPGIAQAMFPPSDRGANFNVRALRWGAGGPGTTIASNYSPGMTVAFVDPPGGPAPPDPEDPVTSSPTDPAGDPARLPTPVGPGGGAPRPPDATRPAPPVTDTTSTTSTTTTTPPEGAGVVTFSAPGVGAVPRDPPMRRPSSTAADQTVASLASPDGLMQTRDARSPGPVAPLAIGVMAITIVTHIAWRRRAHPTGGR